MDTPYGDFIRANAPLDREAEEIGKWRAGELMRLETMKRNLELEYRRKMLDVQERSAKVFKAFFPDAPAKPVHPGESEAKRQATCLHPVSNRQYAGGQNCVPVTEMCGLCGKRLGG